MSRFYGRITPGNGKPVQRQGHSAHGIDLHAAGADSGVHVEARADGSVDIFTVYATDGYRTSESRYARTLLGTYRADTGWSPVPDYDCEHKWRDYGAEIGWVCKWCGADMPQ